MRLVVFSVAFFAVLFSGGLLPLAGAEEFSFDIDAFEKKPFEWGGYIELRGDHLTLNDDSAFSVLNPDAEGSTLDRLAGTLQLDGNYLRGRTGFNWVLRASGQQDDGIGWSDSADVYEAYAHLKPTPSATLSLGKKSYKWGKGYAWNPVGFINRPKDPNNPEEGLEGYITAEADLIRSFSGPLQTVALTAALLPVYGDINDEFGADANLNQAAKIYLLYRDVDIDFLVYSGNSRSTRYGIDFSTNITSNIEIHGELAHILSQQAAVLGGDGLIISSEGSATSYLLGVRYLTEFDLTSIIEFYHNGGGYNEEEMDRFFALIEAGKIEPLSEGEESDFLRTATLLSDRGYGRPYPGRNYFYARFTQKEPFDVLYLTPGLTAILNCDDLSASLTPELVYTGFTNWELRLRFSLLTGSGGDEFAEKQNSNKVELRARWFF